MEALTPFSSPVCSYFQLTGRLVCWNAKHCFMQDFHTKPGNLLVEGSLTGLKMGLQGSI